MTRVHQIRPGAVALVAVLGAVSLAVAGCGSGTAGAADPSRPTAATTAVVGASATLGPLRITGGYVPAPASPDVAAAYFSVTNTGAGPVTLVGVSSDVSGDTSLHTYADGGTRMVALASLPIPAGATRRLAVGSTHVMIMSPRSALSVGSTVALTLTFRPTGRVVLRVPVVAATGPQESPAMSGMPGMTPATTGATP